MGVDARVPRRAAVSGARLDPIHYVTLYLMTEPVDRTLREFMQLGRDLHEQDGSTCTARRTSRDRSGSRPRSRRRVC